MCDEPLKTRETYRHDIWSTLQLTSFFKKVSAASRKKSLSGLDSIQTDGVCAFATLVETAERIDYKIHLSRESPCPDHCRRLALSSSEPEFRESCPHQHNVGCDRCEDLKNAIADLQFAFDSQKAKFR